MSIQWFPGHMHLTKKSHPERIKDIDVVIEVLDARLPGSSANPLLAEMTDHKPKLKVLNKQDVADPERTAFGWTGTTPRAKPVPCRWMRLTQPRRASAIDACHLLAPNGAVLLSPCGC